MELRHLRNFVAIAEERSFTRVDAERFQRDELGPLREALRRPVFSARAEAALARRIERGDTDAKDTMLLSNLAPRRRDRQALLRRSAPPRSASG